MDLQEPTLQKRKRLRLSGIPLEQLTYMSCRYVISPESSNIIRFCGADKERGAYCGKHAELCYVPMSTYKRIKKDLSK